MFPTGCALRWVAVVACAAPGWLRCQDLRVVDSFAWLAAAWDAGRGRIVTIGYAGETCELDGAAVRYRPLPRLAVWPDGLVRAPNGRGLVLVGNDTVQTVTHCLDGATWQQLAAGAPPRRDAFAIACDEARSEVVLFGGYSPGFALFDDTWTFDGAVWTHRQPASAPSPRMAAGAAYDAGRARVVLFGGGDLGAGGFADTWEWNGVTWTAANPATVPPPRSGAGLAYDATRSRIVMFGGSDQGMMADTWEYDGIDWHAMQPPAPVPSPRSPLLVFDEVLGETVMVGGHDGGGLLRRDTWTWNGVRWQHLPVPSAPLARSGMTFADPAGMGLILADYQQAPETWRWDASGWTALGATPPSRRVEAATCVDLTRALVFGGTSQATGAFLNELWAFDGANWSLLTAGGPSPRAGAAMAYALSSGTIVLFGGHDANFVASGDTWTFDGVAWTQRQPASSPSARSRAVASYDLVRQRVVLFGGASLPNGHMNDTWEWDGAIWAPVASAVTPPALGLWSLQFDVTRGRTVLVQAAAGTAISAWSLAPNGWQPVVVGQTNTQFGAISDKSAHGFPYLSGLLLADTFHVHALNPNQAEAEPYGAACTAAAAKLTANTWPQLGASNFAIEIVGAPANSFVALVGAVQSASLPVGPCTLLVQPGQLALLLGTSGAGFTSAPLPVPAVSGFLGVELFFQAATLEATAPAGFTLSKGLRLRLGD